MPFIWSSSRFTGSEVRERPPCELLHPAFHRPPPPPSPLVFPASLPWIRDIQSHRQPWAHETMAGGDEGLAPCPGTLALLPHSEGRRGRGGSEGRCQLWLPRLKIRKMRAAPSGGQSLIGLSRQRYWLNTCQPRPLLTPIPPNNPPNANQSR